MTRVLLLDGDFTHAVPVAEELALDLGAAVLGVGRSARSPLLRSRYCHVRLTAPSAADPAYPAAIAELAERHRPDFILPVGYRSVEALDRVQAALPRGVATCLPPTGALHTALHKKRTLAVARAVGIAVPADYTAAVAGWDAEGRRPAAAGLHYPLFLKAEREAGRTLTALVTGADALWAAWDRLRGEAPGHGVLVQEYVPGAETYGVGLLFLHGRARMAFAHEELRSVPREGGSGTRLRLFADAGLRAQAEDLLAALGWNGVALVEFKRRADGAFVLMEINPKFWASYALASRHGHRFGARMVAETLGLPMKPVRPTRAAGEMVFPLRELAHARRHPGEAPLWRSLLAMGWPPARWDVDWRDPAPWLGAELVAALRPPRRHGGKPAA